MEGLPNTLRVAEPDRHFCSELKQHGDSEVRDGLSLGLLSFTFVKLGTGRHREISPLIWILSVLFLLHYAFLGAE